MGSWDEMAALAMKVPLLFPSPLFCDFPRLFSPHPSSHLIWEEADRWLGAYLLACPALPCRPHPSLPPAGLSVGSLLSLSIPTAPRPWGQRCLWSQAGPCLSPAFLPTQESFLSLFLPPKLPLHLAFLSSPHHTCSPL